MKKLIPLFFIFFTLISKNYAQEKESQTNEKDLHDDNIIQHLKKAFEFEVKDKLPNTRFLDVSYSYDLPTNYTTKIGDQVYEKGKIDGFQNLKLSTNIEVLNYKKWVVRVFGNYQYSHTNYDIDQQPMSITPHYIPNYHKKEFHTYYGGLSTSYFTVIDKKPVFFNSQISFDGSQEGFERLSGNLVAGVVLKSSRTTYVAVGAIGIIDSRVSVPAVPMVAIRTKINDKWRFDMFLPRDIYFRREILKNSRLSLGTTISSRRLYFEDKTSNKIYRYGQNDIKTGFLYEHHVNQKFIATVQGGVLNVIGGKLTEHKKSPSHKVMTAKYDMTAYFQVSFSYNLFNHK